VGNADSLAGVVVFSQWEADPDFVSTVDIIGDYALDCDYRLTIAKIPEPTARFGLVVRLRYVIRTNVQGTGAPIAADTLPVAQPDELCLFEPAIAGSLGVLISSNVIQPTSTLSGIPVTVSGLNTSNSRLTTYQLQALNSVTTLSQGLDLEVLGPLESSNPALDTLTVNAPNVVLPVMNGMEISLDADGPVAAGAMVTWSAHYVFPASGTVDVDLESFEGYHFWRSDLPDLDDFTLLGEIRQCESKRDFVLLSEDELNEISLVLDYDPEGRMFTVVDSDLHDNFPLRYAVSTFDRGFLGNEQDITFEGALTKSRKLFPARPTRDMQKKAYAYPNPFKQSAAWEEGESRVVFENLPPECTVRIFTAATDHVATLRHGPSESRSTSNTAMIWNLRSDQGLALVPGIYIYYIEGSDSFQQTGKLIVAR
jgi:hypothetical protein